jgi:hypothetical protein
MYFIVLLLFGWKRAAAAADFSVTVSSSEAQQFLI